MKKAPEFPGDNARISRRNFVKVGGAALAASAIPAAGEAAGEYRRPARSASRIEKHKRLGRTEFMASDIGMGSVPLREANVVRYAYDKGINYFDTAESYTNGAAERAIGEALQHMDRKKVFITTKIGVRGNDTEETIMDRARGCMERLEADYLDAFYLHGPGSVEAFSNPAFHSVCDRLKAEGRLRFVGLSYHGPGGRGGTSLSDLLCAAAEDGRFDLMLFVYNFMNHEESDRILAACKKNDVGTTAMKTSPGRLRFTPLDPENLTPQQERSIERYVSRGSTREQAIERLASSIERQRPTFEQTQPFVERYGIQTEEQLRISSIHWTIQSPDMHSACVAFTDFDLVDKVVPLSGTKMTEVDREVLAGFEAALDDQYCRHGCNDCTEACPHDVPVSTIMRYAYYYEGQGYEKHAMQKYAALDGADATACHGCSAPCSGACPYGLDVQGHLIQAHSLLTLE
jgi:predicted aldo/keto reductase-like oxidoreductase